MDPSQTLRFTKIYLKNWRNFAEIEVELPRRAFLVGPNASGKTNFLDALRFIAEIATPGSGGLIGAVSSRGYANLLYRGANKDALIVIRITVGNDDNGNLWEYELTFGQEERQSSPTITMESVRWNGTETLHRRVYEVEEEGRKVNYLQATFALIFDDNISYPRLSEPTRDFRPPSQTYLEQEGWLQAKIAVGDSVIVLAEFANSLASVRHFNVVPELVRHPDWRSNTENGYNDFIEQIADTPKPEQARKLKLIQEALRGAVPQFKDLDIALGTLDVPHLYASYANWRSKNARETEASFSDGTLRLIGMLWAMLDGVGPLLVEEPEIALHYGVVRYIPDILLRIGYSNGRQVIVSTHSTEILMSEGIELKETLLFYPEKHGTKIMPASSISEMKTLVEGGLNLGLIVQSSTSPQDSDMISYFPSLREDVPSGDKG